MQSDDVPNSRLQAPPAEPEDDDAGKGGKKDKKKKDSEPVELVAL